MTPSARFRQTLEIIELGFQIQRQSFRRHHPEWSEEQVRRAMEEWVADRPHDLPRSMGLVRIR